MNVKDKRGLTPLHVVARFDCVESGRLLMSRGADPCIGAKDFHNMKPLHAAARFGSASVAKLICTYNKSAIDMKEKSHSTPLIYACAYGHDEIVKILIDHGASLESAALEGFSVLLAAIEGSNTSVLLTILEYAIKKYIDYKSPASVFSPIKTSKTFSEFVNRPDSLGHTPLHAAVQSVNLEASELLVQHGAEIDARSSIQQTPLHVAAICGDKQFVQLLLTKRASIDPRDSEGKTPVHYAAQFGNHESLQLLLSNGAQVDIQDACGLTPFLCAVTAGRLECGRMLLEKGADLDVVDCERKTCLHLAVENEHYELVSMILKKTGTQLIAQPDLALERTPIHYAAVASNTKIIESMLGAKSHCSAKDAYRKTPLHLAAESGKARVVEMLTRSALNAVYDIDDSIRTPLHYAVMNKKRKSTSILLQFGARINDADMNRWTPLMWAAKTGDAATLALLLGKDAKMDNQDCDGNTALHIACMTGQVDIIKILLDSGAKILLNKDELNCLDVALEHESCDAVMAILKHNRWEEVFEERKTGSMNPMSLLIQNFPEAAEVVMDRCIQRNNRPQNPAITYNFRYIDPGPEDISGSDGQRYIALQDMVRFKRQDLLTHPLSRRLLNQKWKTFGKIIFFGNFLLYCLFLVALTTFITNERTRVHIPRDGFNITGQKPPLPRYNNKGSFVMLQALLIVGFASLHMAKEIYQMVTQKLRYLKDPTNLLEWLLYGNAFVFTLPFLVKSAPLQENSHALWQMGTISVFLGFANLILFLRILSYVGLYVTMYLEVVKTLMKVMCLFTLFIVAFSIVFYILFKEEDAFANYGKAIVKTTVMTVGELDYATLLVDGLGAKNDDTGAAQVPFPVVSFIFFYIFLLAMPIVLMNLLIGLAVGDIDSIQQSAFLRNKSRQIDFVSEVERKYPSFVTLRVYRPELTVNLKTCGKIKKAFRKYEPLPFEDIDNEEEELIEDPNTIRYRELTREITKSRQQIKSMAAILERHSEILNAIALKEDLNIGSDLSHIDTRTIKTRSRLKK